MQKKFDDISALTVETIKAARVEDELKTMLVELVENARIATNGLTQEQKIQQMSENQFSLAVLMVQNCLATLETREEKTSSWRSVIVECRREIVAIIVILAGLLLFRPQLVDTVKIFATGG